MAGDNIDQDVTDRDLQEMLVAQKLAAAAEQDEIVRIKNEAKRERLARGRATMAERRAAGEVFPQRRTKAQKEADDQAAREEERKRVDQKIRDARREAKSIHQKLEEMRVAQRRPCSDAEEMFCTLYVAEGLSILEAFQGAFKELGYNTARARRSANKLLEKPCVILRIEEMLLDRKRRFAVTEQRIVEELSRLAFANIADYMRWDEDAVHLKPSDELTRDQKSAVAEVYQTKGQNPTLRVKLGDKGAALEKLGRHLGMWREKDDGRDAKLVGGIQDRLRRSLGRRPAQSTQPQTGFEDAQVMDVKALPVSYATEGDNGG